MLTLQKKKVGKWVLLCCTLIAVWLITIYYRSIQFESNDRYHCIRETILKSERRWFVSLGYNFQLLVKKVVYVLMA
ncbi:hypothetical protein FWK35_00025633 [Aphis craccivora]|uniref:Uncharacterized protein n=1 Tax=Aphis craccivora TaxID=307492 RepID=A0A6G0YNT5_APHCR|nr:hypothetical protein FWK35_00025633 [Aphis craccivora]